MAGQPKPAFYIVLFLIVAALVAFAAQRLGLFDVLAPQGKPVGQNQEPIDPKELAPHTESPDAAGSDATVPTTTVQEYKFVPADKLPPVTSVSQYAKLTGDIPTVKFALNVWAGWGPIILANEGAEPKKIWKTPDGKQFMLQLVLIDNPVTMRDSYAAGNVHIGWGTLDMVPLFLEAFVEKDGKPKAGFDGVMPRIYQQIDWSNGGDGIVCRDTIKTVADLRGKKVVLAQNSPSHFFLMNMLVLGGVQPSEVQMTFTEDAFQAAAAFNNPKNQYDAAVSWAPDIYTLAEAKGNRLLVSTVEANHLIADIWFARADFAKDHPGICEALVRGIFDSMQELKNDAKKQQCAELMAKLYNIPATETIKMFPDAHNTNWSENYQFFLNKNNPTNFEAIWRKAYYVYRKLGSVTHSPLAFDAVMDFSIIQKLGAEPKYADQKEEYTQKIEAKSAEQIRAESDEVLSNRFQIKFFPNSDDPYKMVYVKEDGKDVEKRYEPAVDAVLKEIAQTAKTLGGSRVIIQGHTDSSMFGQVPAAMVKELSQRRAEAIRKAILSGDFGIEPNRITAEGRGWEVPADPQDPKNHAKNRRVEVKVYAAEKT